MSAEPTKTFPVKRCRGCGAEVVFIKTPAGKWMICDSAVVTGGKMGAVIVLDNGVVVRSPHKDIVGRTPHWASCPKARDFKTGGKV